MSEEIKKVDKSKKSPEKDTSAIVESSGFLTNS
jgi:hypothetical protein